VWVVRAVLTLKLTAFGVFFMANDKGGSGALSGIVMLGFALYAASKIQYCLQATHRQHL
jgi:hypothetical protein